MLQAATLGLGKEAEGRVREGVPLQRKINLLTTGIIEIAGNSTLYIAYHELSIALKRIYHTTKFLSFVVSKLEYLGCQTGCGLLL
jgi:hypothetical protein